MLVLSRRENETIVFPKLGIQVNVFRVAGKVVRLGVEAPANVRILRGELAEDGAANSAFEKHSGATGQPVNDQREERHAIRNRLNKAMLGLQLLQAQIDAGAIDDLEGLIHKIFQNLNELNSSLAGPPKDVKAKSLRALIVDDSQNEAELLAQLLQLQGYQTDVVANGQEAINWLKQHEHPDVVLMDMNMPEMDGATAIRQIRENRRFDDVKLYGVSGLEQQEVGLPSGQFGVDRWFTKPVDARQIVEEIRRAGERQFN